MQPCNPNEGQICMLRKTGGKQVENRWKTRNPKNPKKNPN